MEDEIVKNKLVFEATEKALGEIVRHFYPRMSEWHSADLRRLSSRISHAAQDFCVEVADMDYRAQQDTRGGAVRNY